MKARAQRFGERWRTNKKQAWTRTSTLQPTGRSALLFHASRVGTAGGGLK